MGGGLGNPNHTPLLTTMQLQAALVWAQPAADYAIFFFTQPLSLCLLSVERDRGLLSSLCYSALSLLIALAPLDRSIRRKILKALAAIFRRSYSLQGPAVLPPLLQLLNRCIDSLGKIDSEAEEVLCHITILCLSSNNFADAGAGAGAAAGAGSRRGAGAGGGATQAAGAGWAGGDVANRTVQLSAARFISDSSRRYPGE